MTRLKELKEARLAGQEALVCLNQALEALESASSWGTFDILAGGFFSSYIKRKRIKEANLAIQDMVRAVDSLNRELQDVQMDLPGPVADSWRDNFWDLWMDNIFTDFRVQGQIKDSIWQVRDFRAKLLELIEGLDREIQALSEEGEN